MCGEVFYCIAVVLSCTYVRIGMQCYKTFETLNPARSAPSSFTWDFRTIQLKSYGFTRGPFLFQYYIHCLYCNCSNLLSVFIYTRVVLVNRLIVGRECAAALKQLYYTRTQIIRVSPEFPWFPQFPGGNKKGK